MRANLAKLSILLASQSSGQGVPPSSGIPRPEKWKGMRSKWDLILVAAFVLVGLATPAVRADGVATHAMAIYHLDGEFGTTVFDSSGHGNNGTLMGAVLPVRVGGKFERALSFDGVNGFVRVPSSASLEPPHVSAELWVRSATPGANAYLIAKGAQTCAAPSYSLNIASSANGDLFFDLWNGTTLVRSNTPIPHANVFDGNWHHVAGTFDGITSRLYLDGIEQGTGTTVPVGFVIKYDLPTSRDLTIATFNGTCFLPFKGSIDEVRIWNRALSPSELLASAQTGLRSLWHFNETAGSATTADSSGYGNNGTVNGASFVPGAPNFGNALQFDGMDDFVQIPHNASLDFTSTYTLDAWVNVTDVPLHIYRPIFFRGTTDDNDIEVYVQADSHQLIVAHNRGNGGTFGFAGFTPPPTGVLFHLAVVFNGTNVTAYYNGVSQAITQGSGAVPKPLATGLGWWIGKVDHIAFGGRPTANPFFLALNFFKGTIDEVHFSARALSADEIAFLAASATRAELVLPKQIGEEFKPMGKGAVFGEEYIALMHPAPTRTMALGFIVPDTTGNTIVPAMSCATNAVSEGDEFSASGGVLGCQTGIGGLSAFVTGQQIPLPSPDLFSKELHFDLTLIDGTVLEVQINFGP